MSDVEKRKRLAAALKKYRLRHGLSQVEVAKKVRLSPATISMVEQVKPNYSEEVARSLRRLIRTEPNATEGVATTSSRVRKPKVANETSQNVMPLVQLLIAEGIESCTLQQLEQLLDAQRIIEAQGVEFSQTMVRQILDK